MEKEVLDFIKNNPGCSSGKIADSLSAKTSLATVKRALKELSESFYVYSSGKARGTKYFYSPLFAPINIDEYFNIETDNSILI